MMAVAKHMGIDCLYVGAVREDNAASAEEWDGFPVIRVGRFFPLVNGKKPLKYIAGVLQFNAALLRLLQKKRPGLLHASDFEVMPACLLYGLTRRVPVIYNIHDNLADRYALPRVAREVLNYLEGLAVALSTVTVVPEDFRKASLPRWCQDRVNIVRNSPQDAPTRAPEILSERVRILYAGWLDYGRGIRQLLELSRRHPWLDVRIAGEGNAEIVTSIRSAGATYLGFLDHRQVMRETAEAHFVAAFYDPSRPINRAAAPNKLAEALSVGRPVLINDEVLISQNESLRHCLLRVPYDRIDGVAPQLFDLFYRNRGRAYLAMCQAARAAYVEQYAWTDIREQIEKIYGGIMEPSTK